MTTATPRLARRTLLGAAAALGTLPAAQAQQARPIRIVVPFPPGGLTDLQARLLAEGMAAELGQPVIVENRPGAGSIVGAQAVANAAPDGHTLLFTISPHIQVPVVMRRAPFDPIRDFAPIGRLTTTPIVFMIGPSVPAEVTTMQEFRAWGQGRPLQFGLYAPGSTGHAFGLMMAREARLDITHVSYRGEIPALQDLLAQNIHAGFFSMAGSGAQVRAGRVRAIAVAGDARAVMLPEVPTFLETGFSDRFALDNFGGLFAPARTPPEVLARIEAAFRTVATAPAVQRRLAEIETVPAFLDSAAFAALLDRLLRGWTEITTELDLRIDS